jgi:hypothetical protein
LQAGGRRFDTVHLHRGTVVAEGKEIVRASSGARLRVAGRWSCGCWPVFSRFVGRLCLVLLTCESGFGASGRAGCTSDRRGIARAVLLPATGGVQRRERLDVLDGASVDLAPLFLAAVPGRRHKAGDRSDTWLRRVGWFLCKMGMLNFGLVFAWL